MTYTRVCLAALIAASSIGCDDGYPTPIRFDLDGGPDALNRDAAVPVPTAGTSALDPPSGAAGQSGAPVAGAGGGAPAPAPFSCPGCAGVCIFGFCLAAPPAGPAPAAGSGAGSDDDAQDEDADSDEQAQCGDGELQGRETCDPPSSCPDDCDDDDSCTVDESMGERDRCDFECVHTEIDACADDDDCCPDGCDANQDSDCEPVCGNDAVEADETCDPPGTCPSSCDDDEACTADVTLGDADQCTLACGHSAITECGAEEGCCPSGCGPVGDHDCPGCGNGRVEDELGETCDPPGSCACVDEDACTVEVTTGSAGDCDLTCTHVEITACTSGDDCCAEGCGPVSDHDCPGCGNERIEPGRGETCDPPASCVCEDDDPCTSDVRIGTPSTCAVTCAFLPITLCSNVADGCCPSACSFDDDSDCEP